MIFEIMIEDFGIRRPDRRELRAKIEAIAIRIDKGREVALDDETVIFMIRPLLDDFAEWINNHRSDGDDIDGDFILDYFADADPC